MARNPQLLLRFAEHCVIVVHVVVVPDGLKIVPGEGVGMDHPPECLRNEAAVRRIALFFGRHAQRPKYRTSILGLGPALLCTPRAIPRARPRYGS